MNKHSDSLILRFYAQFHKFPEEFLDRILNFFLNLRRDFCFRSEWSSSGCHLKLKIQKIYGKKQICVF